MFFTSGREDFLFCKVDWFSVENHQKKTLETEIDQIEGNRLLNTAIEDLCDYFEQKYRIDVPVLLEENIVADQTETRIDVSHDPLRFISDRNKPFYISGTKIEITVPFRGDPEVFRIQPTTFGLNAPQANIKGSNLILTINGTTNKPKIN